MSEEREKLSSEVRSLGYSERFQAEVKKRTIATGVARLVSLLDWYQPGTRMEILDKVYSHYEDNNW